MAARARARAATHLARLRREQAAARRRDLLAPVVTKGFETPDLKAVLVEL